MLEKRGPSKILPGGNAGIDGGRVVDGAELGARPP
jgi:hypothetical protein